MADNMLRIAGRSAEGYAKAIKTTEDGELIVASAGNNVELASGIIGNHIYLEIPSFEGNGIMVAIDNLNSALIGKSLIFELEVEPNVWLPWHDGEGTMFSIPIEKNAVFGPIRNFPTFLKGRIKLYVDVSIEGTNIAKNKTYADSGHSPDQIAANAFDENTTTRWATPISSPTGHWCAVDVGEPILTKGMIIWGRSGTSTPKEFLFQASNVAIDATGENNWTTLIEDRVERDGEYQTFNYTSEIPYRYYRFYVVSNYGQGQDTSVYDLRIISAANATCTASVRGIML